MDRHCVWNLALIQFLDNQLTAKKSKKNIYGPHKTSCLAWLANSNFNKTWLDSGGRGGGEGHSHFFKVLPNLRLLGVVLLSLTNDLQMSIINSLSLINQNREILPQKNWNYFGKVLKCRTPSGRAFLTLYNPSHKIRRCQGTYCVHFSLFYANVQLII